MAASDSIDTPVSRATSRGAVHEALSEQEDEQPVGDGAAQLVERRALGLEALEQLQPGRALLAVETVEQARAGEVHAHPG
jgi:hypothetical protein